MASSTEHEWFICHFCFHKCRDYSSLISHFSDYHSKNSTKRNEETTRLPRLTKTDRDMLQMLKLHRSNENSVLQKPKNTVTPLSMKSIVSSKQSSFDDANCHTTTSLLFIENPIEQENQSNILNTTKSSSACHMYKYSRREQKNFYASVKRARLKKHNPTTKKSRMSSLIFNQSSFLINLPTIISSRQRLNNNSNNSYPLIFDPNFNSLVKKSTNHLLENSFSHINSYFHLLHSIASQEFQTIVNSNDNQHQVSYTAFSFLNILRHTMMDYSIHLQQNFKRNYFQSFQPTSTSAKIPRYDQSISSSSQIQLDHRSQTPIIRMQPPTPPTINHVLSVEQDHSDAPSVQSDLMFIDRQPSADRSSPEPTITSFIPVIEEQKPNRSPSPIFLKEQKVEPIQIDEQSLPSTSARIRVINGSTSHKKGSSSRKKPSNLTDKIDENSIIRPTRMSTRHNTVKTEIVTDFPLSFETKPVILSSNQISKEWITHTVFYRCHACSHEQFFVVLSRECMNLHLSSHHANMQENFRQRIANFLTQKGRSLKIFQHYLKWQQPWSEKQIEQIFKLSNK